jgi:tetratricopeptide (TPR) repeat protein
MPSGLSADRNLLFGILAVQMDFVGRDALIAAMNAWVLAKDRPLGDLLQEQGVLSPQRRALLEAVADEHLKTHGSDPRQSLAAAVQQSTLADLARGLSDPELQASLTDAGALPVTTAEPRPIEGGLRYQVLRPHALGGLGVVSVARDAELGREVALKEIQARYAEDATQRGRFVREAEITGGLEHPGIVPVYGLGRYADGRPYYAMRLVRGESMQEALRKLHAGESGHTLRGLLTRFVAVCNAVAYAHSRGVLHRDLKPANVMLGAYGETLVVDWGLAKVVGREPAPDDGPNLAEVTLQPQSGEGSATRAGSALGTPAFMSPEQARGEVASLGPATDVYSLGATLYAVLTGRAPVHGRDTAEILEKVRQGDWPPPHQVDKSVPRALDAVCRKAMAREPVGRYRSALELAAEVERWLADEPVIAYREPWPARTGRWVRRHRTPVVGVAAATVVTAVLGGAGFAWWQQDQARRRAGAEAALDRVSELQATARWSEARAALEQAEDRLGGGGPADLRRRLDAAGRDLQLVALLDGLRLERALLRQPGKFDPAVTDRRYREAFAGAGIGAPGEDPGAAAARVAGSRVREAVLAALDDWALVASGAGRDWALEVARRADPDPWRDRLRDPAAWKDKQALAKLAREAPPGAATPGLASAVGGWLLQVTMGEGESLLRSAQALRPDDFWLNYYLSGVLFDQEFVAEGEGFARTAVGLRPESAPARDNLGGMLWRQGRFDEAAAEFRKAINLDPDFAMAQNDLGLVLLDQGRTEEAIALFRKAIDLDPKSHDALHNLGITLAGRGRTEEAVDLLRKAIEADAKSSVTYEALATVLLRQGKLVEAETLLRKAVENDTRSWQAHRGYCRVLQRQGKLVQAEEYYRRAVEREPDNAAIRIFLGWVLDRLGKKEDATASYRQAIDHAPASSVALVAIGWELDRQDKLAEAEMVFRKAIALAPGSAEAHDGLAYMLYRQGKSAEAEPLFRKSIALSPGYANVHDNLGCMLRDAGRLEEAAAAFRRSAELKPNFAWPLRNLGTVLERLGRPDEAEAAFRRALALGPLDAHARDRLGDVLERQKKLAEREALYREWVELDRTNPAARSGLAAVLSGHGKLEEAAAAYREAFGLDRTDLGLRGRFRDALVALAGALVRRGKLSEAAGLYGEAVGLDPADVGFRDGTLDSLARQGMLEHAAGSLREAVRRDPENAATRAGLAAVAGRLGDVAEAAGAYAKAVAADPTAAAAALVINADAASDLAPLRDTAGIKRLVCRGSGPGRGRIADVAPLRGLRLEQLDLFFTRVKDLSPLAGMPLRELACAFTPVTDLAPLRGMPLRKLDVGYTGVGDLSPLVGMPLEELKLGDDPVSDLWPLAGMPLRLLYAYGTRVADLAPLRGMKLRELDAGGTAVADLSPLAGMPLEDLRVGRTSVSDLKPLAGMPLKQLLVNDAKVSDLSPLRGMPLAHLAIQGTAVQSLEPLRGLPLKRLEITYDPKRDADVLHSLAGLEALNDKPVAEFWREVEKAQSEATAVALRDAPTAMARGEATEKQGKLADAAAAYRRASELDPKSAAARVGLGRVLALQNKPGEAAAAYGAALGVDPKNAAAYGGRGNALLRQGKRDEAVADFRKVLELDPKNEQASLSLGFLLIARGKAGEAEAIYRKARDNGAGSDQFYDNFGLALFQQGKLDEAADCYRKVIERNPKGAPSPANMLGLILERQGKTDEALSQYRKADDLYPKDLSIRFGLLRTLIATGRHAEAGAAASKSLEALPPNDARRRPLEQLARQARVGERLPALLRGERRPADAAEGLAAAELCYRQKRHADAARLAAEAFAAGPKLADDATTFARYNAACYAALAGCGKGEGAPGPDGAERTRLRRQALAWLRADLASYAKRLAGAPAERAAAVRQLEHWQKDEDFAGVRDAAGLALLPDDERKEWAALWADVKAVLANLPAK